MLQCGLRQDWDTHAANFAKLRDELLPPLDRAVAAKQRRVECVQRNLAQIPKVGLGIAHVHG